MAEAMPGIAGLPSQTASQPPNGGLTPENLAAFEQARQEMPPSEFAEDLLSTAAEADPIAVAEFKAELRDAQLSSEELSLLDQLVDEVLAAPEQYQEIRQKYLAQGAPEDLLPPSFDPEFFGALNLAVDEMRATSSPLPPQGFAGGGLATLKPMAAAMAQQGRYGDTMLAHISPQEARMLRQMGGSGTINPNTGLPEFFNPLKSIKKVFSKVARAVKKFVRSKVGRIVTTIALAFFLGPAAASTLGVTSAAGVAAVSGFVGATGSGLLAGDDIKTSLKAGVIGGIAGGAGAGLFGGAEAFQAGSYTGPTTISGQWDKAKSFVTGGSDAAAATPAAESSATAYPSTRPDAIMRSPITMDAAAAPAAPTGGAGFRIGDMTAAGAPPTPTFDLGLGSSGVNLGPTTPSGFTLGGVESVATDGAGAFRLGDITGAPTGQAAGQATDLASRAANMPGLTGYDPSTVATVADPAKQGFLGNVMDKVMPSRIEAAGAEKALAETMKAYPNLTRQQILLAGADTGAGKYLASKMPGMLAKYGPLAGIGLGVMGLAGGFEGEEAQIPEDAKGIMGTPGMDLLRKYPETYGLQYGGTYSMPTAPMYNPYSYQPPPANVAKGGSMEKFLPKIGAINGPGTGTSDDIPAMLSDGEFVFTAKAVRNMGDGSRRKGAKKMYALMKKLEDRAHG